MKILVKILKKIIFSFILLYTFNMIAMPINIIIGINLFTIIITTILGIPGLLLLVGINFIL